MVVKCRQAPLLCQSDAIMTGPRSEKPCLWRFVNNKDADQPAHPRSLISAFVIRFLESMISKLSTSKISISILGWFESHCVGNLKDRFCRGEAHVILDTNDFRTFLELILI